MMPGRLLLALALLGCGATPKTPSHLAEQSAAPEAAELADTDAEALRTAVAGSRDEFRECGRHEEVQRIQITAVVSRDGTAAPTVTGGQEATNACIASVIAGWQLPPSEASTRFSFPILFQGADANTRQELNTSANLGPSAPQGASPDRGLRALMRSRDTHRRLRECYVPQEDVERVHVVLDVTRAGVVRPTVTGGRETTNTCISNLAASWVLEASASASQLTFPVVYQPQLTSPLMTAPPEPEPTTEGHTAGNIRTAARRSGRTFRECAEVPPGGHVRFNVQIRIAPNGTVDPDVSGGSDTSNTCVADEVRTWRFPPQRRASQVRFPIVLQG